MKRAILILCSIFYFTSAHCQSTEFSFNLNSGLFSFSGATAESSTSINYDLQDEDGYTNNPYGSKGRLSFGISTSLTHVGSNRLLVGIDFGYELLRSKINIDRVSVYDGTTTEAVAADGRTYLNSNFINLFPKIGYRVTASTLKIDFSAGFDVAYCLSAKEKGSAESVAREYDTERERKTLNTDIRPRLQANLTQGKYGAFVGYSKGLRNYLSDYEGGTNKAFGNVFRFGLSYLFN